jgi:hypothetical protein
VTLKVESTSTAGRKSGFLHALHACLSGVRETGQPRENQTMKKIIAALAAFAFVAVALPTFAEEKAVTPPAPSTTEQKKDEKTEAKDVKKADVKKGDKKDEMKKVEEQVK